MHKARLLAPGRWGGAPKDGLVAVKVQYPNALETMLQDLQNIRVAGRFLSASAHIGPRRANAACRSMPYAEAHAACTLTLAAQEVLRLLRPSAVGACCCTINLHS